jgi:hypothetical protein
MESGAMRECRTLGFTVLGLKMRLKKKDNEKKEGFWVVDER